MLGPLGSFRMKMQNRMMSDAETSKFKDKLDSYLDQNGSLAASCTSSDTYLELRKKNKYKKNKKNKDGYSLSSEEDDDLNKKEEDQICRDPMLLLRVL